MAVVYNPLWLAKPHNQAFLGYIERGKKSATDIHILPVKTAFFVRNHVRMNRRGGGLGKGNACKPACFGNSHPAGEEMRSIHLRYLN